MPKTAHETIAHGSPFNPANTTNSVNAAIAKPIPIPCVKMELNEALEKLEKAGLICEVAVPTPTRSEDDGPIIFNDLASLQQACSDAAITKHEYA